MNSTTFTDGTSWEQLSSDSERVAEEISARALPVLSETAVGHVLAEHLWELGLLRRGPEGYELRSMPPEEFADAIRDALGVEEDF